MAMCVKVAVPDGEVAVGDTVWLCHKRGGSVRQHKVTGIFRYDNYEEPPRQIIQLDTGGCVPPNCLRVARWAAVTEVTDHLYEMRRRLDTEISWINKQICAAMTPETAVTQEAPAA